MSSARPPPVECFFDGACPGNQFGEKGPMRAAYVIGGQPHVREVPDIVTEEGPRRSNNIAEYYGLIFLLRDLRDIETSTGRRGRYVVYGDSELVIRQMTGRYRVRQSHLRALNAEARSLASGLDVMFEEIPRSRNEAGFLLERKKRGIDGEVRSKATREN